MRVSTKQVWTQVYRCKMVSIDGFKFTRLLIYKWYNYNIYRQIMGNNHRLFLLFGNNIHTSKGNNNNKCFELTRVRYASGQWGRIIYLWTSYSMIWFKLPRAKIVSNHSSWDTLYADEFGCITLCQNIICFMANNKQRPIFIQS